MYNINNVNLLFEELKNITNINSIAIHQFVNDGLKPIHILKNDFLKEDYWKNTHKKECVKISKDPVLQRVITGEIIYMEHADVDPDASPEFKLFGIKSMLIIPMEKNKNIFGMVIFPSIDKHVKLNQKQILECKNLVDEFINNNEL